MAGLLAASSRSSSNVIDLDFCRRLPKIELHAHLSGSISRECLQEVWKRRKENDESFDLEAPLVAMPPGKVDYDINTFFPLFTSYIYKLCSDQSSLIYTTEHVLSSFQADGVVYLELRTTPRALPDANISKGAYVDTVLSCISEHDVESQMHTNLILSIDRRNTLEEAMEVVELAIARKSRGVVGVDLCGNPARVLNPAFGQAFAKAKQAGLKVTLHFAETPVSSTDEELQILLSWEPDRLGHLCLVNDVFREEIVSKNIGVELCLTCNVSAKMISGTFCDHHFGWWKESGVGVALGTDDVGVFLSKLSEEYHLAAEHFALTKQDVRKLCEGAVDTTFASEQEKDRLRSIYAAWSGWA